MYAVRYAQVQSQGSKAMNYDPALLRDHIVGARWFT